AGVYFAVTEMVSGSAMLEMIRHLDRSSRWTALARGAMRDDFYQAILSLTDAVLRHTDEAGDAAGAGAAAGDDGGSAMRGRRRVDSWLDANRSALEKVLEM